MFRIAGITSKGFEVLAEALSGKTLSFTRMEYGSGILPGLENIVADSETLEKYKEFIKENPEPTEQQILEMLRTEATDLETKTLILDAESLVSKKGDIGLYEAVSDNGITTLTGKVVDSSVSVDFRARELGVYAQVEEGEEVLFAYFSAVDFLSGEIRDSSDFISIPALLGQEQVIKVNIATGQAANITMKYNLAIYVSKKEFDETVAKIKNQIAIEVSNIIAEAPESFDTLKEISVWITEHAGSAAEMNTKILQNEADIKKLKDFKENIGLSVFNLIYPVGVTYPQYPQQASPNELWGEFSTWEVIDYDGAFFRAEGGNADAFIEKSGDLVKQGDQNKSHSHSFTPSGSVSGFTLGVVARWRDRQGGDTGVSVTEVLRNGDFGRGGGKAGFYDKIVYKPTFSGSKSYTSSSGGEEERPVNYTFRVWVRTA